MKKQLCVFSFLLLFLTSCSSTTEDEHDNDKQKLSDSLSEITDLIVQSVCGSEFTCSFIAVGEKACGGPKSYLAYSSSIDVDMLETLVANYNASEKAFNTKWNIVSDCSVPIAPSSVSCEDGTCVAVYNN